VATNEFENSNEGSNGSQPDGHDNNRKQVSERKADANRRNAQKSTGPNTPEGKRWSSRNSLKHGLCASRLLVSDTGYGQQVNQLLTELREYFEPETLEQDIWVQRLAIELWRQQRGLEYECVNMQRDRSRDLLLLPYVSNLIRYQSANTRNLKEALKELERLKNQPADSARPPESAGVPEEPPSAHGTPSAAATPDVGDSDAPVNVPAELGDVAAD